jgi:predicted acylesterase/phospholipase RssA
MWYRYDTMLIWQAARATSAALTYFDPITIDHKTYSDGGLLFNNPISQVHSEASEVFPNRKQIIVSLGTGKLITKAWDPNLLTIAKGLAEIATETEKEADGFYNRDNGNMAREMRYFRFNVPELGGKDLAESDPGSLADIRGMTEKYLDEAELRRKVQSCAGGLAEGTLLSQNLSQQDLESSSLGPVPSVGELESRMTALR